ncbi:MAG: hypothetical protein IPK13_25655 [Deltaproteobacteria bacterium]|nr:hypothetical protein [Deltaproteobacteria bacterium]
MMSRRLKFLGLVILGLVLWKVCGSGADALRGRETKYLLDRPWVDRLVENPKEIGHVMFLTSRQGSGATIHGSAYRFLVNGLRHQEKDGRLSLTFLQDNVTIRPRFRVFECPEAPKGLDLCLELDFRAKKVRLYSAKKWDRETQAPAMMGEAARWGAAAATTSMPSPAVTGSEGSADPTDSPDEGERLPSWFEGLAR